MATVETFHRRKPQSQGLWQLWKPLIEKIAIAGFVATVQTFDRRKLQLQGLWQLWKPSV